MPTITKTKILVKAALSGQKDKQGVSKYDHCLRVADNMVSLIRRYKLNAVSDYIHVALLHDVIEDSDITEDDLHIFGYNNKTIDAVKLLTHDEGNDYNDYIDALCASGNLTALLGKLADNLDNDNPDRLGGLDEKFRSYLTKRYVGVREKLEKAIETCL
jgi:(p)ppGpp synthase/HD superfamily hydrolase